ncbi:MAG: radical SAM protein [Planctomycetes bacterium]|nr:radical SAM protein [Planctomycetota bacterium]MCB9872049.1 radical SAM protein [Planctomycetota bacterium]MCB9888450.1 radical SAM protein [Planctomycetota bacterium]
MGQPEHPYSAQTRANEARAFAAERAGSGIVDAWPIKMIFEFTAACNLHCFMCGFEMTRDKLRATGRTKFVLDEAMFHKIAETAFPHISIASPTVSGEPFVLPYFDAMIEAGEKYDTKFELFTNGMLLRGERLHRLMPRLACLTVSFDGATKPTFDYVRTGGKFEVVLENVQNFAKLRRELGLREQIEFNFNVTLLAENVHELPQIVEIAAANDVDTVTAGYVMVLDESVRKSSPLNCPEKTNEALRAAHRKGEELGIVVRLPKPLPSHAPRLIRVEGGSGADSLDTPAVPTPVEIEAAPEQAPAATAAPTPEPQAPVALDPEPTPRTELTEGSEPVHKFLHGMPADWGGKFYCNMPWRQVFIGQSGEVWPCCSPSRPQFGNGFEQDFMEIWNGPEYQRLREGLYSGDLPDYCKRCPFLQEAGTQPLDAQGFIHTT